MTKEELYKVTDILNNILSNHLRGSETEEIIAKLEESVENSELIEEDSKKCMYARDNYTDEDRKVLCDGCEEKCEYAQKDEPVSIWHNANEETPTSGSNILMVRKEEKDTNYPPIAGCFHGTNSRLDGRNWGYYNGFCYNEIEPPVKWAYIDDILNCSNVQRTVKNWKEPVSEELEIVVEEIVDPTVLNAYGVKEIANRLRRTMTEPVSEDLEKAAESYAKFEMSDGGGGIDVTRLDAFIEGAQWQKEQFEKNRLKHCNSITNEQAELEQGFIDQHLDKYQRMPTYLDAIEYGMKLKEQQKMMVSW